MPIRLGIRGRLVALVAGPVFLVYVGVLGAMAIHLRRVSEAEVESQAARRAAAEAAQFHAALRQAAGTALAIADAVAAGAPRDDAALGALLRAAASRDDLVAAAAFVHFDDTGRTVALEAVRAADGWRIGAATPAATADWAAAAAAVRRDRAPAWLDPADGGGAVPAVRFAAPCVAAGELLGVAAIAVEIAAIRDRLGPAIVGDARFVLIDRAGRFVVGRSDEDVLVGRTMAEVVAATGRADLVEVVERMVGGAPGVERLAAFDGEPPPGWERWREAQWLFHAPIESTGWTHVALLPAAQALAGPNRRLREGAVALGATLVLLVVCILAAARRFAAPIAELAAAVRRIAAGDLAHRMPATRRDELGDLARDVNAMAADLQRHVEEVARARSRSRESLIFAMARLAESRDDDTGKHLVRICLYVEVLAAEMARTDASIDEAWIRTIVATAALHDIGKVGIPDGVLKKPGKLTDEERRVMQGHTTLGGDTLLDVRRQWEGDDFLRTAAEIAFGHHERWDGAGYPFGLAGEEIARSARIVAVADVYDALTSRRCYKEPMPHERARTIIVEGAGSHFDPTVVAAFEATEGEFRRIAAEHG